MPIGATRVSRRRRLPDAIPDSVTNHWEHTEGSGTTLVDSEGELDGTISGAVWEQTTEGKNYLQYDGTDDETDLGSDSRSELADFVNNGTGAIGLWVRSPDDFRAIFGTNNTSDERAWFLGTGDGTWRFGIFDGSTETVFIDAGTIPDDTWTPVVATLDGAVAELYAGDPLNEVASESISNTVSGDLDNNVTFAEERENYNNVDISETWYSPEHVSQSEGQNWVDATSGDY